MIELLKLWLIFFSEILYQEKCENFYIFKKSKKDFFFKN